ncbi:MAG TPA: BBP7 family outer membrane beta-barrel protein [Planctomycetaceae bacterium]|nr:BBP7 family outer membrane beta-barrel protein [Planctomycetaceae bacterium]
MRSGVLAAAILIANASSAWSEAPQSSPAAMPQASSEPLVVADAHLGPQPQTWTGPLLADQSSYFGDQNRFWGSAELLWWSIKPGHTPPLVTLGTETSLGALGPETTVLFGGDLDYDSGLGGRFTAGYWLDACQTKGLEASYLFLNSPMDDFSAFNSGAPGSGVLARPFFNVVNGLQESQLASFPGIFSGRVGVSSDSQLQGAELNGICNLCRSNICCYDTCCHSTSCGQTDCCGTNCCDPSGYSLDLIGGFRYLNLNEDLEITELLTFLPTAPNPPFTPGATILISDRFDTRNSFYGAQIGARGEWRRGSWFVNATAKLALGNSHQEVRIRGTTVFTNPGGPSVAQPGGLLALPTNIGTYSRDRFAVVPEIGVNLGYQVTNNLRAFVGYSFIYWSSVVRPGDQIDLGINPTQLPDPNGPGVLVGPARPAFRFRDTDFWAQGINFGVEFSL